MLLNSFRTNKDKDPKSPLRHNGNRENKLLNDHEDPKHLRNESSLFKIWSFGSFKCSSQDHSDTSDLM